MSKIFFYEKDGVSQVENFFSDTDEKIRSKLKFQLAYLQDEKNQFVQPHVKHFSIEKYRRMYELRIKRSYAMVRVIFYEHEGEIILLHAFYKKDRKDTERALETGLRILNKALTADGNMPDEYKKEYIKLGKGI